MTCANCGTENAPGAKFCSECGARLADAPQPREERKVVSVVFCDVVGSTARAESADPEDVRAALNAFYAQVRADLERFGGTVEKYIGDAVMAVFGAPVAHEDDPERAVRAALAIRDWAREDGSLQVRIAVNTGEALVAVGARAEAGEAMVAGDVVNTAARLQSSAPENGVLVGEATHRATREEIEYEAVDGVQAKGKAEPVTAWLAVEARGRVAVELAAAATPLVGRDRERDLLLSAFGRARDDRSTELVTIVGVPGIGKSRLVAELYAELEADAEFIRWRHGRSLPYGEGLAFWALAEMVRAEAGIRETDSSAEAGRKLSEAVAAVLMGDDDAALDRSAPAAGRRPRGHRRVARGELRGLAPLPRGAGRAAADGARLRGPALGRRRPARLRGRARRLGDGRAAAPRRHGAAGAHRPPTGLGRGQAQRPHGLARAARRRGHGSPHGRGPRPPPAPGRDAAGAARPRRRQPAVRRAVRADARGARRPR